MKRVLVAVALLALAAGGYALAAGTTVRLTGTGPNPQTVTVSWGDTVTFVNDDSQPHAIEIPRDTFTSEAIPSGGTLEVVFDGRGGNYQYRQLGPPDRTGRIVVEVEGEVTMATRAKAVRFGRALTLAGTSTVLGWPVTIQQRVAGRDATWVDVATVDLDEEGAFTTRVKPTQGGLFRAAAAAGQLLSTPVFVDVRPVVKLSASSRSVTAGTRVTLTVGVEPEGSARRAVLEIYDRARKRWDTVSPVRISAGGTGTVRWQALSGRTLVRVTLVRSGLRSGFAATSSRWIAIVGR